MTDQPEPTPAESTPAESTPAESTPAERASAGSAAAESAAAESEPRTRFGTVRSDGSPVRDRGGLSDAEVQALGTLSEALEVVEYARGQLYEFHRRSGTADLTLQRARDQLREAGHGELADELEDILVGRNVLPGQWTFEVVEAYDEQYWSVFRAMEQRVRERLGRPGAPVERHVFEAELKHAEQR